ncbi:MAG: hypothetical protein AAF456_14920 [Planctomycetota bacterium]
MCNRNQAKLFFFAILAVFAWLGCNSVSAQIGFESGHFDFNWETNGTPCDVRGTHAHSGQFHAVLGSISNEFGNVIGAAAMESHLGVLPGSIADSLDPRTRGLPAAGSLLQGSVPMNSGETVRFAANFLFEENANNLFWNDSACWMVQHSDGGVAVPLRSIADTYSPWLGSLNVPSFVDRAHQTRYFGVEFTAPADDTYTFSFIVIQVDDMVKPAALLLDEAVVPIAGTIVPEDFSVLRGALNSGSVFSLKESDNVRLEVANQRDHSLLPPVQIEFASSTTLADPWTMQVELEAHTSRRGLRYAIEIFNFQTGRFEQVARGLSTTTETAREHQLSGNCSRFIDPMTGDVIAKVNWRPGKYASATGTWTVSVDSFRINFNE